MMIEIEETELCVVCNKPGPSFYIRTNGQYGPELFSSDGRPSSGGRKSSRLALEGKTGRVGSWSNMGNKTDSMLLLPQLRVIFVLQKIFKHSVHDETTLEAMQALGNPSEWFEICNGCSKLADAGIEVIRKLKELEEEYGRVLKALEGNLSAGKINQNWGLENCILVRNKSTEKSKRRLELRNKIRGVDSDFRRDLQDEIKTEPENRLDIEDWICYDNDSGLEYPSALPRSNESLKTVENVTPFSDAYPTSSNALEIETELKNDKLNSNQSSKPGRLKRSTRNVRNFKQVKTVTEGSPKYRSKSKKKVRKEKREIQPPLRLPKKKVKKRKSYFYIEPVSDDDPIYDDDEDPDFKFSGDEGEDSEDEREWQRKQKELMRQKQPQNNDKTEEPKLNRRRSLYLKYKWFYDKCDEYLDMNLVKDKLPVEETVEESTSSAEKPDQKKRFRCPSCKKSFYNKYLLIGHIQEAHLKIDKPWSCNQCSFKAKCVRLFRRHLINHDNGKLKNCTICNNFSCVQQITIDCHIINHQKKVKSPTCHICQSSFDVFKTFVVHMTEQHGFLYHKEQKPKQYFCEFCSKPYPSQKLLEFHLLKTHDQDVYKEIFPMCSECGEILFNQSSLDVHMFKMHAVGESAFFCEHCGKGFKLEADYRSHLRLLHTVQPEICRVCGISVKNSVYLRNHMTRNHIETRNMSMEELDEYSKKKNESKPFNCTQCTEAFSFSFLLYHHYRKNHPEVTDKFKCDICGKGFSRQSSVKRHIEAAHLKLKASCEYCGKMYTKGDCLDQHRRQYCRVKKKMEQERALSEQQGSTSGSSAVPEGHAQQELEIWQPIKYKEKIDIEIYVQYSNNDIGSGSTDDIIFR